MKKKIIIPIIIILLVPVIVYFCFPEILLNFSINSGRKAAGLVKKSIQVDKYNITYLEGGKGQTILLLHGLGGNKDNWTAFLKPISSAYHIIALDLPGSGESSKIVTDLYNIAAQTERVDKIVKALKLDKIHLIGNGIGGTIAGKYAAQYPDKVLTVAFFDTEGISSPEMSEFDKNFEKGINPLSVKNVKDLESMMKFMFVNPPSVPSPVKRYMVKQSILNSDFNQKIYMDVFSEEYSFAKDLPKIKAKALILWGDTDRKVHVSSVKVLEKGLSNSKSVIMKNCGHFPMREKPVETADQYLKFLKG